MCRHTEEYVRKHVLGYLFDFDPSDSPVEEVISTTGPTDFEEILIFPIGSSMEGLTDFV